VRRASSPFKLSQFLEEDNLAAAACDKYKSLNRARFGEPTEIRPIQDGSVTVADINRLSERSNARC
jgi:hypothetical protein